MCIDAGVSCKCVCMLRQSQDAVPWQQHCYEGDGSLHEVGRREGEFQSCLNSYSSYTEVPLRNLITPSLPFVKNKKAQLSQTNPRDAKACQKLLQFDVLTTLSLTILAYLHAFSCCCIRNLRNPEKFTENSNYEVQGHPRSSILVPIESPYVTCY